MPDPKDVIEHYKSFEDKTPIDGYGLLKVRDDVVEVCEWLEDKLFGGDAQLPITYRFMEKMLQLIVLFDKKQKDYGPKNISEFGRTGVLIRMNDKLARIKNITNNGMDGNFISGAEEGFVQNESLRDSYMDIAVYAVIDWLLEEGVWE